MTKEHVGKCGPIQVFFGSAPCVDFSSAKLDRVTGEDGRKGMRGSAGSLFNKLLDIWGWVKELNPDCQYVVENVVFDDMVDDWKAVCEVLGEPIIMNAVDHSYTWRKRAFWTSIEIPEGWRFEKWNKHPNEVLNRGCTIASGRISTITASWLS